MGVVSHVSGLKRKECPGTLKHVAAVSEGDKTAGPEWQKAIDDYLAGSHPATN